MTESQAALDQRSIELRRSIIGALKAGNRGHLASALSLVEILRVLYDDVLRYDAKNAKWPDRDRFVLSKGHGCLALYAMLADRGFFPAEEMLRFCKADGLLGGHPETRVPGVEASTGSLGHGLSIALGFAIAARVDRKAHRIIAVIGDGESNEGSIWEAALSAAKHKLDNLTVVVDYNKQQSYDTTTSVQDLEPLADKWRAFNFAVVEVDGHDVAALRRVFRTLPFQAGKPSALICHTVKGRGIGFVEKNLNYHHLNKVDAAEVEKLLAGLDTAQPQGA